MRRFSAVTILPAVCAAVLIASSGAAFAADSPVPASDTSAAQPKRLHSIPLDGAVEDVPVAPRVVRELTALRPKDDLIICIAGCSPGRDLVIYAKPQEELVDGRSVTNNVPVKATPKLDAPGMDGPAAAASSPTPSSPESGPASAPMAKADGGVVPAETMAKPESELGADEQAKAPLSDPSMAPSTPDVINAQPNSNAAASDAATPAFEPTVDMPKGAMGDDAASGSSNNEPSSGSLSEPDSALSDQPANDDKNR